MKFGLPLFAAIVLESQSSLPTLRDVAETLAHAEVNVVYYWVWLNLHGDALTAEALRTKDRDRIQAALLLSGTVMAKGVALPVATNGLSALCEAVVSPGIRDDFFAETVLLEKKEMLLERKRSARTSPNLRQEGLELFPFANLHYVCGPYLPLSLKVAVFKSRVWNAVATDQNIAGEYRVVVPLVRAGEAHSLEDYFKQLFAIGARYDVEYCELGLLFDVVYQGDVDQQNAMQASEGKSAVSQWLSAVFERLFPSDCFETNQEGEYRLNLWRKVPLGVSVPLGYYSRIGELLGLAIMNSVPIPVRLEKRLLRALLSHANFQATDELPAELQRVRHGFYEVTSMFAVWGYFNNPKSVFSEAELGHVLMGHF